MREIKSLLETGYFKLDKWSEQYTVEDNIYFYTLIKGDIKVYLSCGNDENEIFCTVYKNDDLVFNNEGDLLYIIGLIKPFL